MKIIYNFQSVSQREMYANFEQLNKDKYFDIN